MKIDLSTNPYLHYIHRKGLLINEYDSSRWMLGVMPTGPDLVTIFWSEPLNEFDSILNGGIELLKKRILTHTPIAQKLFNGSNVFDTMNYWSFAKYGDIKTPKLGQYHNPFLPIVYIGDAAHGMSPQLGQGANMSLLDSYMLHQTFETAASSFSTSSPPINIMKLLKQYSKLRSSQIIYYQYTSRFLTPLFQSHSKAMSLFRDYILSFSTQYIPYVRKQTVLSLAGMKSSLFGSFDIKDYKNLYSQDPFLTRKLDMEKGIDQLEHIDFEEWKAIHKSA